MSLEEQQKRIKKLFGHGDRSFHLAKLLEEAGELAKALNKWADMRSPISRGEIADEIADVLITALIFSGEFNFDASTLIEHKLKKLESNPKYLNFLPPRYRDNN